MGSAPASLADNPFLITLLLEMQTTIFLRTEMSRKTEYVHNPCFLSANILKILGVFAENQNNVSNTVSNEAAFYRSDSFGKGGIRCHSCYKFFLLCSDKKYTSWCLRISWISFLLSPSDRCENMPLPHNFEPFLELRLHEKRPYDLTKRSGIHCIDVRR